MNATITLAEQKAAADARLVELTRKLEDEEITEDEITELEELQEADDDLDEAAEDHPKDLAGECGATRSVQSVFVTCGEKAGHPGLHSAKMAGRRKGIQWARRSGDPS